MTKTFSQVHMIAKGAAQEASYAFYRDVLGGKDRGMCGFAWVIISLKLGTKLAKELYELDYHKPYGTTGKLCLWNPSSLGVQNVDCLYAGAKAYADVLVKYGYTAYADSRLD